MSKKVLLLVLGLILVSGLMAGLFLAIASQSSKPASNNVTEPYRSTISGELVCLPHKDSYASGTKECAEGIKTESGEYYVVDFNLISQQHQMIQNGEHISANGLVTPIELLSTDEWQKYDVVGVFSITDSLTVEAISKESYLCTADAMMCPDGTAVGRQGPNCEFAACPAEVVTPTETVACTMEAKICPDGSAVGRQGPNCEFTPCPPLDAQSGEVTTYLGGNATTMNVTVSPTELVSDSRCPKDVNCFWAGTVEVRTTLATAVTHGEHVFTLHEPYTYGEYTVTLIEVSPEKTVESIPSSSYRFTFEIKRTN